MDRKGVTLIELLIVVAIIGILAAIGIPGYLGYQKRAARSEAYANLEALRTLQEQYYAERGEYAPYDKTTSSALSDVSAIQAYLPGFKPGPDASLGYSYRINYTVVNSITTSFIANALGKTGTKLAGDSFWVDKDNNKNY
jgi:prepilin-type N-terminal cleavage/methylation domain-containing protein